ncbi:UDP binding domain-containing protein [Ancylobacter sp. TS-1]|uniref:UDP binding domain-containing protein n=1 Tax=Ancylobacter sp. TS-1 TaxID=1850374 RepID=UPI001265C0F4|nr:UDP binding domain-containing protein [Ancylobacter sp. TS-1]QFR33424.1 hypothetical protein GBB76_09920 [Ancylobacter sp. TS-1]
MTRNTRVVDVIAELQDYGITVDVHDPWVDAAEAQNEYGITPIEKPEDGAYDGVILAVAHQQFAQMGSAELRRFGKPDSVLYDLKYVLSVSERDLRL